MSEWSNIAKVVAKRTYSRNDSGVSENWPDIVSRYIRGNTRIVSVSDSEKDRLSYFGLNRKALPAGRGLWFSGAPAHETIGGAAVNNCWFVTSDDFMNFVLAQDLLMLGGGVGLSIEHKYSSKLPKVKRDLKIFHKLSKDADFIIPDSRSGWCELTRRILESFFVTGRSFSYSTACIRGAGEAIKGFGGLASGPLPLVAFAEKFVSLLLDRQGKNLRPIDCLDLLCSIGELVVAGNVRRSAILIIGDCWDKDYLRAKRWDLGPVPTQRAMANLSVNCDDVEDLHPLFWKTYESGEAYGIVNRKVMQTNARMGELKKDTAVGFNPCVEACLEDGEPCNLQEIFLPNLADEKEFVEAAVLMHRYGKRVTMETYHHDKCDEVVKRNRRIGTGITGCLQSPLFNEKTLNSVYKEIQIENRRYSKELKIPESIRTTVVKPSGTLSLLGDCTPGIHPGFSRYYTRRVRFASNDPLIPTLKKAGHYMEPVIRFDGSIDHGTLVVDFYGETPTGTPTVDEGFDTWKQLDVLLMAQRCWADQAVSVTVYYRKEEIPKIKEWLSENLSNLKAISFLSYNEHGFKQAPLEAISKEQYEKFKENISSINSNDIGIGDMESLECAGGVCPIK